jgi:hypothetical protein
MKLWSRGLGKQELKMDFMRYAISKEGQEVVISGRITDPVNWDFWIRFDEGDVPGLVRVATNRKVIGLVARRWFKKLFFFRKIFSFGRRRRPEATTEEPLSAPTESRAGNSGQQ